MAVAVEQKQEEIQPSLFEPRGRGSVASKNAIFDPGVLNRDRGGRTRRLFTLGQRANLRGTHERRRSPEAGKRYVVSMVVSRTITYGSLRSQAAPVVTVTVGECLSRGQDRLRVVNHYRASVSGAEGISDLVRELSRLWRCTVVVAGNEGENIGLAEALMAAVAEGSVEVYVSDGSQEWQEFDGQIVRAQVRSEFDGGLVVASCSGDDGYVLGLALLLRALGPDTSRVLQAA